MNNVELLDDYKPHLVVTTNDNGCHVIPVELFNNIVIGKSKITDIENYEDIFKVITKEWLKYIGVA